MCDNFYFVVEVEIRTGITLCFSLCKFSDILIVIRELYDYMIWEYENDTLMTEEAKEEEEGSSWVRLRVVLE